MSLLIQIGTQSKARRTRRIATAVRIVVAAEVLHQCKALVAPTLPTMPLLPVGLFGKVDVTAYGVRFHETVVQCPTMVGYYRALRAVTFKWEQRPSLGNDTRWQQMCDILAQMAPQDDLSAHGATTLISTGAMIRRF